LNVIGCLELKQFFLKNCKWQGHMRLNWLLHQKMKA